MRILECKNKEVINIHDCKRLGYVSDIEFCPKTGNIEAFIIPGPPKFLGCLGREQEFVIPFSNVKQIGEDIILVEVETEEVMEKCKDSC